MTTIINGSSPSITFSDGSAQTSATRPFLNRIINGAMVIDQRNAGASVTITNTSASTYTLDRWFGYGTVASKFSMQQNAGSVTPPIGFTNYLGCTSLSAYSVGSGDLFQFSQNIEGFNTADLQWGSANAKTVTLSFWVRSSLTGTFGGSLTNGAADRSYPYSYTISSANTWEYKTITVAGDTSGTWVGATNGIGLRVRFSLGAGSTFSATANTWATGDYIQPTGATSVVGTNGATFYITGVQLEVGSTATSFDYRPYGTELALCQRYYLLYQGIFAYSSPNYNYNLYSGYPFPVTMRATPTIGQTGVLSFDLKGSYTRTQSSISISIDMGNNTGVNYVMGNFSSLSTSQVHSQSGSNSITFSAEL